MATLTAATSNHESRAAQGSPQARRCDDESCVGLVRACPAIDRRGHERQNGAHARGAVPTGGRRRGVLRRGANSTRRPPRPHRLDIRRGAAATPQSSRLHAGASARVRGTGDTALDMARGRASPEVVALLEHAEAAGGPWRSFVDDPDALAAQAEHAKTCAVCRAKLGEPIVDDASNEASRREAALAAETAATSERCRAAEDAAALSRALVLSAARPRPRRGRRRCARVQRVPAPRWSTPRRATRQRCSGLCRRRAGPRAPDAGPATDTSRPGSALAAAVDRSWRGAADRREGGALFEPAALVDFARADPQSRDGAGALRPRRSV